MEIYKLIKNIANRSKLKLKNANKIGCNEEINRLMEKYIVIHNAKLAIEQAAVIIDRHEDCNDMTKL